MRMVVSLIDVLIDVGVWEIHLVSVLGCKKITHLH